MATIYKPPAPFPKHFGNRPSIFLSGSIEMGKAEDWQTRMEAELGDIDDLIILNPRRDDWDSSWVQAMGDNQFTEQVTWELEGLEKVRWIPTYLSPGTMSPITLLELGLFSGRNQDFSRLIVCCPEGFWRKGNVDIVCARYQIRQVPDLEGLINLTRQLILG